MISRTREAVAGKWMISRIRKAVAGKLTTVVYAWLRMCEV